MPVQPNPIQALYKSILRHIFFGLDAEVAHNLAIKSLGVIEKLPLVLDVAAKPFFQVNDARLRCAVRSLEFANPVGLAAGFDKNAELLSVLPDFGFGFIEVGTFTPLPQEGQKKPRLFRLKQDRALLNRMGFNNPGVKVAAQRLKENLDNGRKCPIGANIGKGRDTPIEEAVEDYLTALENVHPYADYIVLNVSSPNTPNLRNLQRQDTLAVVLNAVMKKNRALAEAAGAAPKPVFTKVSPDCSDEELEDICRLAVELNVGLIATNTTIDYSLLQKTNHELKGGVSGKPILSKANAVLRKLRAATKGIVPLIGVGGIFSAEDAYEKIRLGASLVQVYTGWIYEGPSLVPEINQGLLKLLERDGFKNIQEAVGTALP
jgi:dihydroorotate dehydrogenase